MPAKRKARAPKKTKRVPKPKVPKAENSVKVVVLECKNCGEREEKVHYCESCDSPMDVVDVHMRGETDVIADSTVSKENGDDKPEDEVTEAELGLGEEDDVDSIIKNGGLGNIFSEGDGAGDVGSSDETDTEMTYDDMISTLDEE